jgi:hypothetical protein
MAAETLKPMRKTEFNAIYIYIYMGGLIATLRAAAGAGLGAAWILAVHL